jgi:hypothetical protein
MAAIIASGCRIGDAAGIRETALAAEISRLHNDFPHWPKPVWSDLKRLNTGFLIALANRVQTRPGPWPERLRICRNLKKFGDRTSQESHHQQMMYRVMRLGSIFSEQQ